jgi:hypothetical protein
LGGPLQVTAFSFGGNMPIYSIQNQETNEVSEVNMKFTELQEYLTANPEFKQIFTKFPGVADPTRLGIRKPDDGFRDMLRNVKHHHKKDSINDW